MKRLTLTLSSIDRLNNLKIFLAENKAISNDDKFFLAEFLSQIPSTEKLTLENLALNEVFEVSAWNSKDSELLLNKWITLFDNIPGYDYAACCLIVSKDDINMLEKNIIMTACFAPSMSYNLSSSEGYYIYLKDNGSATFMLPTLQDAEQYPELYNFKGSWKEAYLLLIETLKKGWPMEEFPEELKPLLKK